MALSASNSPAAGYCLPACCTAGVAVSALGVAFQRVTVCHPITICTSMQSGRVDDVLWSQSSITVMRNCTTSCLWFSTWLAGKFLYWCVAVILWAQPVNDSTAGRWCRSGGGCCATTWHAAVMSQQRKYTCWIKASCKGCHRVDFWLTTLRYLKLLLSACKETVSLQF